MVKDHLIIFFPLVDWEAPWQRYQHLASRFSKNNEVVYINSAVAITYLLRNPLNLIRKWLRFIIGKRRISPNLAIYYPPPCLPFERSSRWINFLNQYILFLYIKIFVRPRGPLILWNNDPYKYLMIKLLRPKLAVYDCPDAIVFTDGSRKQKVYYWLKKMVLRKSAICFFTSKPLLHEGRKYSRNCSYVPNGVDTEIFLKRRYRTPESITNVTGAVLGVVGTLDERIDLDLINYMLEAIQEVILLLVGPIVTKMGNLATHPRVILAGKREYGEIPIFIERFHVALIPYRINKVTNAVYPVKLHEYLILGKPVVSTNLPEVRPFSNVVLIAESKEEFVRHVVKALEDKDDDKRRERIEVAKRNSWDERVIRIYKEIKTYLDTRSKDIDC